jgi:hypothetical protein
MIQSLQLDFAFVRLCQHRIRGRRGKIINSDLGTSAAIGAAYREGFERVLSSVALGEVGIVVSREKQPAPCHIVILHVFVSPAPANQNSRPRYN